MAHLCPAWPKPRQDPLVSMASGLRAACESAAMRGFAAGNSPGVGARAYTEPTDKKNANAGCWMLDASMKSCEASNDALRCTAEGIGDKGAHL
jgi:hypothetical protein